MRLAALGLIAAAALSACNAPQLVDPQDAAERMVAGEALGTALGTGLGATFAINPAIGAVIGAETGAALGAFTGVITAAPLPTYHPVVVPAQAVIPHFYDGWPPGYHAPPGNPETQQPPAG
jgi:hypothetical protein